MQSFPEEEPSSLPIIASQEKAYLRTSLGRIFIAFAPWYHALKRGSDSQVKKWRSSLMVFISDIDPGPGVGVSTSFCLGHIATSKAINHWTMASSSCKLWREERQERKKKVFPPAERSVGPWSKGKNRPAFPHTKPHVIQGGLQMSNLHKCKPERNASMRQEIKLHPLALAF